jgi:hypothetical protein
MTVQLEMEDIFRKKVAIKFSEENTSSDSGILLAAPVVNKLGIIDKMANILHDPRNPLLITHTHQELIAQRIYPMIAGYNDLNDSLHLRKDLAFKTVCKDGSDLDLASTSTLSRLDNEATWEEIVKLTELQVELYLKRNKKRFDKQLKKKGFVYIPFDLDPTDVETYGSQQLSFFNGYYREKCYLPMVIDDGVNSDLICGILRPGTKHATYCLTTTLFRIFSIIEKKYPSVRYHLKADSGFQSNNLFSFLEAKTNLTYEIALSTNKSLKKLVNNFYQDGHIVFEDEKILKIYNEFGYRAGSWDKFRRIIYKVEINRHGCDVRYVVTNINDKAPQKVMLSYFMRAEVENRIKELKSQAGGDTLSSTTFAANCFRFCLACFSFIIVQEMKKKLKGTTLENAYVSTIREKLIKTAGIIDITTRRIVFKLSKYNPFKDYWGKLLEI